VKIAFEPVEKGARVEIALAETSVVIDGDVFETDDVATIVALDRSVAVKRAEPKAAEKTAAAKEGDSK
jgi:hypothetical protein